jgi:hypothetical protein
MALSDDLRKRVVEGWFWAGSRAMRPPGVLSSCGASRFIESPRTKSITAVSSISTIWRVSAWRSARCWPTSTSAYSACLKVGKSMDFASIISTGDPKAYLEALRKGVRRPFYLVVEKILASHESLCGRYAVAGVPLKDWLQPLPFAVLVLQ